MSIDETTIVFPNNVVVIIADACADLDEDLSVFRRPLRPTDPAQSVGVFATQWDPNEESWEMQGRVPGEPTLQTYRVTIQAANKDTDQERGLAVHSIMSTLIRSMLVRNETLSLALRTLNVSLDGTTEQARRWGVRDQRYLSNEIRNQWIFLSVTDFWLDTQTIHIG